MYHISDKLQISSPTLIEILLENGYNILSDNHTVTLITPYSSDYITTEEVRQHLEVANNMIYKLYQSKLQEVNGLDDFMSIARKNILDEVLESNKMTATEIVDLLIYYKAISILVHRNKNLVLLIQTIINKKKLK